MTDRTGRAARVPQRNAGAQGTGDASFAGCGVGVPGHMRLVAPETAVPLGAPFLGAGACGRLGP
jgi:hypothetical protein